MIASKLAGAVLMIAGGVGGLTSPRGRRLWLLVCGVGAALVLFG